MATSYRSAERASGENLPKSISDYQGSVLGFYKVPQNEVAVVERFDRYIKTKTAGLNWRVPFINSHKLVTMKTIQFDLEINCRTANDAFLMVPVVLQINVNNAKNWAYQAEGPAKQVRDLVESKVMAVISQTNLADVFKARTEIEKEVIEALKEVADEYGFKFARAAVNQPKPSDEYIIASNRKQVAERLMEAADAEGKTDKIKVVRYAEGLAESAVVIAEGRVKAVQKFAQGTGMPESEASVMTAVLNGQLALVEAVEKAGRDGKQLIVLGSLGASTQAGEIEKAVTGILAASKMLQRPEGAGPHARAAATPGRDGAAPA